MKRVILRAFVVAGAAIVLCSCAAQPRPLESSAAQSVEAPAQPEAAAAAAAAAAATSNVACYFRKDDGTVSWQWGLTGSNAYFSFQGQWRKTDHTKIQKFFSTAEYSDICDACKYAQAYYKETGNLFAIFAATSGAGYNYPVVLGGNEISPLY